MEMLRLWLLVTGFLAMGAVVARPMSPSLAFGLGLAAIAWTILVASHRLARLSEEDATPPR